MADAVFATVDQYRTRTGDQSTSDADVELLLVRASADVDELLIGAIFATDDAGMPTDTDLLDVLMRATCAQAEYVAVLDDPTGALGQYQSLTVGGISRTLAGAGGKGSSGPERFGPRTVSILRTAGLLPSYAIRW